jgi:hypothetical protein
MSLFHDSAIVGASGQAGAAGYQISRSLRFNSSDSAFLSRTPASAGNRKTWTWAGWVKFSGSTATPMALFGVESPYCIFGPGDGSGSLRLEQSGVVNLITTSVVRDYAAWYHVVVTINTTQATAANRAKIYINGTEQAYSTATYPAQNADLSFNSAVVNYIGAYAVGARHLSGYLADIHFIDGQALDPTSFGEFSATTGVWVPKAYTGSYGTNGFRLPFSDNSAATATTLGKDAAGSNNWTPNNLSVTAGAGNDSLVDVPTNRAETDTGAGGEVRGNYATWNPLLMNSLYMTARNGNLEATCQGSNYNPAALNIHVRVGGSGKWYCEFSFSATPQNNFMGFGLAAETSSIFGTNQIPGSLYMPNGQKSINGTKTTYGSSYVAGDIIGVTLDEATGSLTCYKNGVSQGLLATLTTGSYQFIGVNYGIGTVMTVNAGQRPFAYTAPSGFKALCTANLPAPLVTKPSDVMDVALWTGNGSSPRSITGLGFNPDFVWIKERSAGTYFHRLFDAVRGTSNSLYLPGTEAENTYSSGYANVSSFNSDGFTLTGLDGGNNSSVTYVAWTWDAGSTTVTNTQGSISSQVRANPSAGFSVATWTGQTAAGSIGHGLGVAPSLIICKARSNAQSWGVYHKDVGINNYLLLDSTGASTAYSGIWGSSAPTSTVFNVPGNVGLNNNNGWTYVAYCFAPVAGYSAFGSYTGNGSADGPFVYTGFRPRWIMIKCSSTNNGYTFWDINDATRSPYNTLSNTLCANLSDAEDSSNIGNQSIDFLSNGFKIRTGGSSKNISGQTYIYAAFAEHPFQYARAR